MIKIGVVLDARDTRRIH